MYITNIICVAFAVVKWCEQTKLEVHVGSFEIQHMNTGGIQFDMVAEVPNRNWWNHDH